MAGNGLRQGFSGGAGETVVEPRSFPPGRGWEWIREGFGYFKASPWVWIGMIVVFVVIMVVVSIVPLGGIVAAVLSPMFVGGLMLGCRAQDSGEGLRFGHLFAGFQTQVGRLAVVGLLYLVAEIVVALVAGALMLLFMGGTGALENMDPSMMAQPGFLGSSLLVLLVVALLLIPVLMAFWFAPPLVALHGQAPFDALKMSYRGCLRNMGAFLVYGLVALVLCMLAAIPMMLGFLVLGPTLVASLYVACKDIFSSMPTDVGVGQGSA